MAAALRQVGYRVRACFGALLGCDAMACMELRLCSCTRLLEDLKSHNASNRAKVTFVLGTP